MSGFRRSIFRSQQEKSSMFTGIVQNTTEVQGLSGLRLTLSDPGWGSADDPYEIGESISVNGCCLTLVGTENGLAFELSEETLAKTTLSLFSKGTVVNLERAMKASDRLGGHIVQGHVDQVGKLISIDEKDGSHELLIEADESMAHLLADKGSVTLDGISLTVIEPAGCRFKVAIIPHTWQETNLSTLSIGSRLNVEYDILAKHVASLLSRSS
jgi:riboflavin synthase